MSSWHLPVCTSSSWVYRHMQSHLTFSISAVDSNSGAHGCGESSFIHQAISPTFFNSVFKKKELMLFLFIFDYLGLQRGDKTASGFNAHGLPPHPKMCRYINKWRALVKWWPFSFPFWLNSLVVSGIGLLVQKVQEFLWIRLWFPEFEMAVWLVKLWKSLAAGVGTKSKQGT